MLKITISYRFVDQDFVKTAKQRIISFTWYKKSKNRNNKVFFIFFDIAGAFDKVYHNGLIYKLIKYKVPHYLIQILIDFLKDRKFNVQVGSHKTVDFDIMTVHLKVQY